jgi:hypothetical protein
VRVEYRSRVQESSGSTCGQEDVVMMEGLTLGDGSIYMLLHSAARENTALGARIAMIP